MPSQPRRVQPLSPQSSSTASAREPLSPYAQTTIAPYTTHDQRKNKPPIPPRQLRPRPKPRHRKRPRNVSATTNNNERSTNRSRSGKPKNVNSSSSGNRRSMKPNAP